MDQNGSLQAKMHQNGPFWSILVQYTFRQYRGHSLYVNGQNEPSCSEKLEKAQGVDLERRILVGWCRYLEDRNLLK